MAGQGGQVKQKDTYTRILERIFRQKYHPGDREVAFKRTDITAAAAHLRLPLPKNLGDVVYSFRYRRRLPRAIALKAGRGETWIIRPAGRAEYRFSLVKNRPIAPSVSLAATKIPDCTPGIVAKYSFEDEQALLARIRYNRLVDVFSGVTCYSLQNHLRTTVPGIGQVETDEIYVGVDKRGAHYVFPVQAKGGKDRLNVVQIEQDMAVCRHKFPHLVCRAMAAQFLSRGEIALFEFGEDDDGVGVVSEKHYVLVPPDQVTEQDLKNYRSIMPDEQ